MSYRFKRGEPVVEGLRRSAIDQIDKALDTLEDDDVDHRETVHEVRKRCKKIRGLIRVTRPAFEKTYKRENKRFRDAARALSDLRDATSIIECVEGLSERFGDEAESELAAVRAALEERREEVESKQDVSERIEAFKESLEDGRDAAKQWDLEEEGFGAIGPGVEKTYDRARKAMGKAMAEPTAERWHEWRKRVKYHRYHCKLLRDLWPPLMMDRRDEAKRLSDLLGDAHDLDVLRETLTSEPERFGGEQAIRGVLSLAEARRAELRAWAGPPGVRLLVEKGKRFTRRLGAMHEAWQQEGTLAASLPERSPAVLT
jgi:CHAD domain-containing protein